MSTWVNHIREFAKSKGITYGCALSDPECSISYQAKKLSDIRKKASNTANKQALNSKLNKRFVVNQLKETLSMQAQDYDAPVDKTLMASKKNKKMVQRQLVESLGMRAQDFDAPVSLVNKKPRKARPPKYATEEEKKNAKRKQTLESNKRRYHEKKNAKNAK